MAELEAIACPECLESVEPQAVDRRGFLRTVGGGATALAVGGALPALGAQQSTQPAPATPAAKAPRPAEALCRELWGTLTPDQRRQVVLPWNSPNRHRMYNAPMNVRIGQTYTAAQQDLLQRIVRALSSGEEGYRRLSRNNGWDTGGGFNGCGANFFGDVAGRPWAWVFSGHHLTVRCDGDSEPDTAWGGPMYYGHSPDGHSQRNVFHFQTRAVSTVFDSLTDAQRRSAVISMGRPGEGAQSVAFRRAGFPGIRSGDLTADQRQLVEGVMRDILSPYRREDVDEVMQIVRRNGGLERLHFAFYRDAGATDETRWSYWRIEGPGFVWNYRVLPHVHCYVNVAARAQG